MGFQAKILDFSLPGLRPGDPGHENFSTMGKAPSVDKI